jgi:predicted dehydrogenase
MAISVFDRGEMIKEAEKANRRLFVVKQNRYNPPVKALKEAIDKNRLGKILSVQLNCFWNRNFEYYNQSDWKGTMKLDGGTLFTQFSHFIDLLYWMFGDIKKVESITKNLNHDGIIEFEDSGVVIMEFYNGVIGTINYTVNSFEKNMEGSLTVFGEYGTVKIGGQYLNVLEYQNIQDYKISDLPSGNPPNNYGQYVGSMSNHDRVYENVIDVLINKGTIGTNGFEGLKTVEIIDKIYTAARRLSV